MSRYLFDGTPRGILIETPERIPNGTSGGTLIRIVRWKPSGLLAEFPGELLDEYLVESLKAFPLNLLEVFLMKLLEEFPVELYNEFVVEVTFEEIHGGISGLI